MTASKFIEKKLPDKEEKENTKLKKLDTKEVEVVKEKKTSN